MQVTGRMHRWVLLGLCSEDSVHLFFLKQRLKVYLTSLPLESQIFFKLGNQRRNSDREENNKRNSLSNLSLIVI